MKIYDTGDWNKKIRGLFDPTMFDEWDRINGKFMAVTVELKWPTQGDPQRDMLVWADDHSEGYFYQAGFRTEGGTPIIRVGDTFSLTLVFQKKEDAFAFRLRWA